MKIAKEVRSHAREGLEIKGDLDFKRRVRQFGRKKKRARVGKLGRKKEPEECIRHFSTQEKKGSSKKKGNRKRVNQEQIKGKEEKGRKKRGEEEVSMM